jgi:DNA-binding beta-propeller fold protein YncE
VQFLIGNDGKLYAQSTINTPGIFPVALAVDPTDSYLYVVDTYQPLPTCSPVAPCAGSVAIFPILTKSQVSGQIPAGSLGSAVINNATGLNYFPVAIGSDIVTPQGVNVLANGNNVYVTAKDSTTAQGYVFGFSFSFDTSTSPINATATETLTAAGTLPGAITSSPNSSTVFVADGVNLANAPGGNNIFVYTVNPNGSLSLSAAYPAGNTPSAIAIDPAGSYFYVANAVDSNISAFSVSGTTLSSLGNYAAGQYPDAILVEPRMGQYIYVANYLGSNVSGFALNTANNTLVNSVNTPFKSDAQPTALAGIPHNGSTH